MIFIILFQDNLLGNTIKENANIVKNTTAINFS